MATLHLVPGAGTAAAVTKPARPLLHLVTLRLRLTFWYAAVMAFVIALFGMVVYGGTSFVLIRQVDTNLTGIAQNMVSHLRPTLDGGSLELPLDRFGFQSIIV